MGQHHARIILADNPADFVIKTASETEIYRFDVESIGIDQIRDLITEAHRRPRDGYVDKRIILTAFKITSEAQQASLKILEETPKDIFITLVLPNGTQFLDTVLSRVQMESVKNETESDTFSEWQNLSHADRIAEVESRAKAKDLAWMQLIKSDLQKYCVENSNFTATELKELQIVAENLLTRGASNKMLLEHLALTLPLTR